MAIPRFDILIVCSMVFLQVGIVGKIIKREHILVLVNSVDGKIGVIIKPKQRFWQFPQFFLREGRHRSCDNKWLLNLLLLLSPARINNSLIHWHVVSDLDRIRIWQGTLQISLIVLKIIGTV